MNGEQRKFSRGSQQQKTFPRSWKYTALILSCYLMPTCPLPRSEAINDPIDRDRGHLQLANGQQQAAIPKASNIRPNSILPSQWHGLAKQQKASLTPASQNLMAVSMQTSTMSMQTKFALTQYFPKWSPENLLSQEAQHEKYSKVKQ